MTPRRVSQTSNQPTGSPLPGEPVYLAVGKLRRPHGVHGEIILELWTDFPERLRARKAVFVGENHEPQTLASRRTHAEGLLISFDGFSTPEEVGKLRNQIVYARANELPVLPDGEYYHHQLLGLRVLDEAGLELGTVTDILETGANDVLVVRPPAGPEILLPVIEQVVLGIDLPKGELHAHVLPGLRGEEE